MARRGQHSFLKRQKEMKRKEKAAEKMAFRQGKIERPKTPDEEEQQGPDHTETENETETEKEKETETEASS
jgi:hypothetical protein